MARARAALAKWDRAALKKLVVVNDTRWSTTAIRSLLIRCLKHLCLPVRGHVRIAYSAVADGHHGSAALGSQNRREDGSYWTSHGLNMSLTLPRDPSKMSLAKFARVMLHEALHWKGVDHKDMTPDQLYCRGPLPAWAEGVEIVHREPKPKPSREEVAAKKIEAMRSKVQELSRKVLRAERLLKKWTRKLRDAERRREKMMVEAMTSVQVNAYESAFLARELDLVAARAAADVGGEP